MITIMAATETLKIRRETRVSIRVKPEAVERGAWSVERLHKKARGFFVLLYVVAL